MERAIQKAKNVTQQIEELIRSRIESGAYPADQRMPSEDALAQELSVSRASVRSALGNLTTAGYLRRRHGDGTYPCANVFEIGIRSGKMWDVMRQIEESGRKPALRPLGQQMRPATRAEATLLSCSEGDRILSLKRLFLADGTPVALIETILRADESCGELPQDATAVSPFEALTQFCRRHPDYSAVDFTAVSADQAIGALLQVPEGSPLLKMVGILSDAEGVPLMAQTEYYPGSEGFRLRAKLMI
jgi:GntR family transcriptional regulator